MILIFNIFIQLIAFKSLVVAFNCKIPEKCRLTNNVFMTKNLDANEKFYSKSKGIICKVDNKFRFQINSNSSPLLSNKSSYCDDKSYVMEFKWPKTRTHILSQEFNFTQLFRFFFYSRFYMTMNMNFLGGFDLHTIANFSHQTTVPERGLSTISIKNSKFIFYSKGKRVKNCTDMFSTFNNSSKPATIFQLFGKYNFKLNPKFYLINIEFSDFICPLVFSNANIRGIEIASLVDTFYKRNLLRFWNQTFSDLNSTIQRLHLAKVKNINLDSNLLNPSVFFHLNGIHTSGEINLVSENLFTKLPNLDKITFSGVHFRKLIHKNGIGWIKSINKDINRFKESINDTDLLREALRAQAKFLLLNCEIVSYQESLKNIFPDEDICIYKDFPFEQMVFLFQFCEDIEILKKMQHSNSPISCTYLWFNIHYYDDSLNFSTDELEYLNYKAIFKSDSFVSSYKKCNLDSRLELCFSSEYALKPFWDSFDFYILNKKLESAVKIAGYLVGFLGTISNFFVVFVVFSKKNKEIFKDLKHYVYLGLNSLFCLFILSIELLSWMCECFYPYEVFCFGIHRAVSVQLFKMIVKEFLMTVCRFMSNFSYVAFALNRIALIGNEHNSFIKFMSEVKLKRYLGVTLFLSILFSWIKYFKYQINHGHQELNFPISNELDIFTIDIAKSSFLDFYFIFNSISDFLNYVGFFILCVIIDVGMLVSLRKVLTEKAKKIQTLSAANSDKTQIFDDIMNKNIKMVVLNTAIGLFFKLPLSFLPIVNAYAQFYYKDPHFRYEKPSFDKFYSYLFESGFYSLIQVFSNLLYLISLSIQFFVYNKFDTKFKEAKIYK